MQTVGYCVYFHGFTTCAELSAKVVIDRPAPYSYLDYPGPARGGPRGSAHLATGQIRLFMDPYPWHTPDPFQQQSFIFPGEADFYMPDAQSIALALEEDAYRENLYMGATDF